MNYNDLQGAAHLILRSCHRYCEYLLLTSFPPPAEVLQLNSFPEPVTEGTVLEIVITVQKDICFHSSLPTMSLAIPITLMGSYALQCAPAVAPAQTCSCRAKVFKSAGDCDC